MGLISADLSSKTSQCLPLSVVAGTLLPPQGSPSHLPQVFGELREQDELILERFIPSPFIAEGDETTAVEMLANFRLLKLGLTSHSHHSD